MMVQDAEHRWAVFADEKQDTEYITAQLKDAIASAQLIAQSVDPYRDKRGALVKAYHSEIDNRLQPYSVYVPLNYDSKRAYPLVVGLHGAWSNHFLHLKRLFGKGNQPGESDVKAKKYMPELKPVDCIVACPNGRETMGYSGIAEEDVWRVVADVKRAYNIDENRIYLTGLSMGGGGTWAIGLHYPDRFAAIAPVCGWTDPKISVGERQLASYEKQFMELSSSLNIAENAQHLPIHIFHGDADKAVDVEHSRVMNERLHELGYNVEYTEYPGVGHNSWDYSYADAQLFDWFLKYKRNPYPKHLRYKTSNPNYNQAYWARIDEFTQLRQFATIDATITGNTIDVKTDNVERYSLSLNDNLVDITKPIIVKTNSVASFEGTMPESGQLSFHIQDGQKANVASSPPKVRLLPGDSLKEGFNAKHIYIYGTSGEREEISLNRKAAKEASDWGDWVDVRWTVKKDVEVTQKDIAECNLILYGSPDSNAILRKVIKQLPITFDDKSITVAGKQFTIAEDVSVAMIYPNPLNPNRYMVINYIGSEKTIEVIADIARNRWMASADVMVWDKNSQVVSAGLFDKGWRIQW